MKILPKRLPKSMKNRDFVFGAFLERLWTATGGGQHTFWDAFWRPFSSKSRKKGIQKGMQNSMQKKYRKLMPKGSQNDAKMDTKINENSYFSEKG